MSVSSTNQPEGCLVQTLLAKQFLLIFHPITPIFLFQKAPVFAQILCSAFATLPGGLP